MRAVMSPSPLSLVLCSAFVLVAAVAVGVALGTGPDDTGASVGGEG